MSSKDIAVSVRGLSKSYSIAHNTTKHTTLGEMLMHRFRRPINRQEQETFWALKDVSFDIKKGDVVGIIGRNGAGKSTLLKILSRITEPTTGQIDLYGRVGSLLEVGTGFHPELTGRENIYLNGAILGMKRSEIARQFDAIVDFSGTEKFLDTPVKRYSSGMYVRLAFSVAAHLNPEILIVDEVLAVGDAQFQKKCLGKMQDVAELGKTILFVSHQMQTISTLTQKCLMLVNGKSAFYGNTSEAIRMYLRNGISDDTIYVGQISDSEPRVTRVEVMTSEPGNIQMNGECMEIHIEVNTPTPINGARLSFQICDPHQQPIVHLWIYDSEQPMLRQSGTNRFICRIPVTRLYIGRYSLTVHFSEFYGGRKFETIEGICPFEIVMYGKNREGQWITDTCKYIEEGNWEILESASIVPTSKKVSI